MAHNAEGFSQRAVRRAVTRHHHTGTNGAVCCCWVGSAFAASWKVEKASNIQQDIQAIVASHWRA